MIVVFSAVQLQTSIYPNSRRVSIRALNLSEISQFLEFDTADAYDKKSK